MDFGDQWLEICLKIVCILTETIWAYSLRKLRFVWAFESGNLKVHGCAQIWQMAVILSEQPWPRNVREAPARSDQYRTASKSEIDPEPISTPPHKSPCDVLSRTFLRMLGLSVSVPVGSQAMRFHRNLFSEAELPVNSTQESTLAYSSTY